MSESPKMALNLKSQKSTSKTPTDNNEDDCSPARFMKPTPREKTREELQAEVIACRPKFIPSGYEKLDKHIYKSLFYSTSSQDVHRSPLIQSQSQPLLHKEAVGIHMGKIHANGGTKFKVSRAPLYARTMCSYTSDFVPRPLDGFGINKECYNLFKEKCETSSGSATAGGEFSGETNNMGTFKLIPKEDAKKAIPPNFKPKQQMHVNKADKLLVTDSQSHLDFKTPLKQARTEPFKPKFKRHKSVGTLISQSSYNREYDPKKYDKTWPVKFANMEGPPPPTSGYTGKRQLRKDSPRTLKPEQFHIGDLVPGGLPG